MLCSLKQKALKSVVSLLRYSKTSEDYIDFGTGFVLHVDKPKAVIVTCVEGFDEDEESIKVLFHDGTIEMASVFVSSDSSIYTSFIVYTTTSIEPVTFSAAPVGRGDLISTLARVLTESHILGMYTGSVIMTGKPVSGYENLFALTCPVAGPCQLKGRTHTMSTLIGAPVFDMEADVAGLIERSSEKTFSIKFARLSSSVTTELNILFGDSNWKEALARKLDAISK